MPEKTEAEIAEEKKAADAKKAEEDAAATKVEDDKPTGKDGKPFDQARLERDLEKARDDAKKAKERAKDAEEKAGKYDELTEQQKSDLQKAEDRASEAEKKAGDADAKLRRANLVAALSDPSLGIVNARAAAKLIEGVEYDDDGEPTNLGSTDAEDSLIAKFLGENEYLRGKATKPKPPSTDASEGDDKTPPELTAQELEVAKASDMTPEEYAAFKGGGSLADLKERGLVTDPSKKDE